MFSRSLLMATPVDSSFTSQSDDFENLNDSEMSESLIYCLNGNEPMEYVDLSTIDTQNVPVTPSTTKRHFPTNSSTKRPLKNENVSETNSLDDQRYIDYSCTSAKKNYLELDETAL